MLLLIVFIDCLYTSETGIIWSLQPQAKAHTLAHVYQTIRDKQIKPPASHPFMLPGGPGVPALTVVTRLSIEQNASMRNFRGRLSQ